MRKLCRCKRCGYNFLVFVRDEDILKKKTEEETKDREEHKCPKCGAPI
jgi:DNA-directed RNA polymerase subunit RPC12/RpoP